MPQAVRLLRLVALTGLVVLLTLAWAELQAPFAHAAFIDSDADGTIDLAEEIFGSSQADPASTPETTGSRTSSPRSSAPTARTMTWMV